MPSEILQRADTTISDDLGSRDSSAPFTTECLSHRLPQSLERSEDSFDALRNIRATLDFLTMRDFTTKQARTATIFVLSASSVFYITGICYYSTVGGLSTIDAALFSVSTITTVGYGQANTNISDNDKVFTIFFTLLGVHIWWIIVGNLILYVVSVFRDNAKYTKKKIAERIEILSERKQSLSRENVRAENSRNSHTTQESITSTSFGVLFKRVIPDVRLEPNLPVDEITMEEYLELSKFQNKRIKTKLFRGFLVNIIIIFIVLFLGTVVFACIESESIVNSLFWAIDTLCSIGVGEVVPASTNGKIFAILYMLVGCFTFALSVSGLATYALSSRAVENEQLLVQQFGDKVDEETLYRIIKSKFFEHIHGLRQEKNMVTKSEFILLLLSIMEKVDDKDVLFLSKIFERLDRNNNGKLDYNDFQEEILRARERLSTDINRPTTVTL